MIPQASRQRRQLDHLERDPLRRIFNRILNEVRGIHRVALDISSKPLATIE